MTKEQKEKLEAQAKIILRHQALDRSKKIDESIYKFWSKK